MTIQRTITRADLTPDKATLAAIRGERHHDMPDDPATPEAQQDTTASASQNRDPNLWQEIKHADTYDHSEYRSRIGLIAWWPKDGAWHVALPCPDPDPVTKLKTGGFRWTEIPFPDPESAMVAVESRVLSVPTPANLATSQAPSAHTLEPIITAGGFHHVDCPCLGCLKLRFSEARSDHEKALKLASYISEGLVNTQCELSETAAERDSLKWQLGEADGMYGMVKRERDEAREQVKEHQAEYDRLSAIIEKDTLLIVALEEQVKTLLAACKQSLRDNEEGGFYQRAVMLEAAIASVESEEAK